MATRRGFFLHWLSGASALAANIERRVRTGNWQGVTREDLPTPCLVLDLDLFEKNLSHMAVSCRAAGMNFRGHVKIHKSVDIARRQQQLGAIGVTVATEAEAELMCGAGIRGVLLTRQPAGREKTLRVAALARRDPSFMTVADDPAMVEQLDAAAGAARAKLNVVVDVFAGMKRAGIEPGEKALALAQLVTKKPNLRLRGLMAYSGTASHTKGWEARKKRSLDDIRGMLETAELCKKSGLPVEIRTGGSTGTYNIDGGHLTELQAGSYMFMDTGYAKIGSKAGSAVYDDFAQSLTVLTTVYHMTGYRSYPPYDRSSPAQTRVYNEVIRQLAEANDCLLADVWEAEGQADWLIHPDGVHANAVGNLVIGRASCRERV